MRKEAKEWDTGETDVEGELGCLSNLLTDSWYRIVWRGLGGNIK
jgi:hypothetical protein